MPTPRQPLLVEEDVSLQELHPSETASTQASRRRGSDCGKTTGLISIHSSTQHFQSLASSPVEDDRSPWGDEEEVRLSTSSHLRPKPLEQQDETRDQVWFSVETLLVLLIIALAVFGTTRLVAFANSGDGSSSTVDCDGQSATGVERSFLVDIYVSPKLTFTRAKLLDLAWDTFIGQALKFVHGWVLYHVVSTCLTAIMETDPIPPRAYLDLQFSTASFSSVWSLLLSITVRKPARTLAIVVWLFFEIAYVVSFVTVWSATTGYISGNIPTYRIGGFSSISARNTELQTCWVLDDHRVTTNGTKKIILGPQAEDAFGNDPRYLTDGSFLRGEWYSDTKRLPVEMNEFMDVYSYFLTKSLLFSLLQSGNDSFNPKLDIRQFNQLPNGTMGSSVNVTADGGRVSGMWKNDLSAAPEIGAWQLEHKDRVPIDQRVEVGPKNGIYSLNETTKIAGRKARFLRNETATSNATGTLPYNSTIWIGGEELHLKAPFLSTSSNCSGWLGTELGVCFCLNGVPVNERFSTEDRSGCLSDVGYTWGFSSGVLSAAVLLEALWILSTWFMWRWARWWSPLVARGRTGAGTIRSVLDAAEAITDHLGEQHSAYTEKQLAKRLQTAPPFRYMLENRDDGVEHIGIRPMRALGKGDKGFPRRRIMVENGTLYG